MDSLKASSLVVVAVLNSILGLLVYLRAPRRHTNILFFLASLSVGIWALGNAAFIYVENINEATLVAQVFYIGPLIAAYAYFLMALSFPDKSLKSGVYLAAGIPIIAVGLTILINPVVLFGEVFFTHSNKPTIVLNTIPYAFYSFNIIVPIVAAVSVLAIKSRDLPPVFSQQAKILSYGMLLGSSIGVYFNLILPWMHDYSSVWVGPNAILIIFLFASYGTLKHRLFVIRANIFRGLFNLTLKSAALVVYLLIAAHSFIVLYASKSSITKLVVFLGLVIVFYRLYSMTLNKLLSRLSRISHKELAINGNVSHILTNTTDIENALSEIVKVIFKDFNLASALIVVDDKVYSFPPLHISRVHLNTLQSYQNKSSILSYLDLVDEDVNSITDMYFFSHSIGISVGNNHFGLLIVGEKKSGIAFSEKELLELQSIGQQIALGMIYHKQLLEIKSFNKTLQKKILTATARIKNANDELKSINVTKDEFIAIASHQLMPQITSNTGFIDIISDDNKQLHDIIPLLKESNRRMVKIVTDMLNLGRIEAGSLALDKELINVNTLINDQVSSFTTLLNAKKIKIIVKSDVNVEIEADKFLFGEVIYNLIDNAIQYSKKNDSVYVSLIKSENDKAILCITDEGIGMLESDLKQAYVKYYRSSKAKKIRPNGTGIGLFTAKKICDLHGFNIKLSSKLNVGTKVEISMQGK